MIDVLPYNFLAAAPAAGAEARWFTAHRTAGWAIRQLIELTGLGVALGRPDMLADAAVHATTIARHIAASPLDPATGASCRHHFQKLSAIACESRNAPLLAAIQRLEEVLVGALSAGVVAHDIELWLREAFGMTVEVPLDASFVSMWRAVSQLCETLPDAQPVLEWKRVPTEGEIDEWLETAVRAHAIAFGIQATKKLRVVRVREVPRFMWRRWFAHGEQQSELTLVLASSKDAVDHLAPLQFFTWRLVHDAAHLAHLTLLQESPPARSLGLPPFVATAEGFALLAEWRVLEQLLSSASSPWQTLLARLGVPVAAAVHELANGLWERVMRLALDQRVNGGAVSPTAFVASFSGCGLPVDVVRSVTAEWTGLPGMGAIYPLAMAALASSRDLARLHQLLHFEAPLAVGEREIEEWTNRLAGAHGHTHAVLQQAT